MQKGTCHIKLQTVLRERILNKSLLFQNRFEVDLDAFPIMVRVEKNLEKLEPFVKAHALRQPDCPPELAA